jgi:hypothetical protein
VHRAISESAQRQEISRRARGAAREPNATLARALHASQRAGLRVLSFNEVPDGKNLKMVAAVGA